MNIPYIKLFGDASATVDLLSDAEAGRLLKSVLHYANGQADELPGQEKLVFAMLKAQIDRDVASYQVFLDKQRENGKKGGRPKNPSLKNENPENPSLFLKTQKSQEKEKDKEKDKEDVVVVVNAHEDEGPFGLTDADIHQSLLRDQQIETAARSIGLQTTEAGLMRGRRLADQYGLDKLLDAISKAVDAPKWAYVEGVLRNGGQNDGNRRNHQQDTRADNPYAFLHDDAV